MIPEGAHVHESVLKRMAVEPGYRPVNLPKDYVTVPMPVRPHAELLRRLPETPECEGAAKLVNRRRSAATVRCHPCESRAHTQRAFGATQSLARAPPPRADRAVWDPSRDEEMAPTPLPALSPFAATFH